MSEDKFLGNVLLTKQESSKDITLYILTSVLVLGIFINESHEYLCYAQI